MAIEKSRESFTFSTQQMGTDAKVRQIAKNRGLTRAKCLEQIVTTYLPAYTKDFPPMTPDLAKQEQENQGANVPQPAAAK